eukprot:Lithocolla_globosa_v1_NODE_2641_length_1922_cov_230.251741.p2 type:complete len:106 gc:universal NODE_2641_length_1922_cov_230.251741:1043-1360(+)
MSGLRWVTGRTHVCQPRFDELAPNSAKLPQTSPPRIQIPWETTVSDVWVCIGRVHHEGMLADDPLGCDFDSQLRVLRESLSLDPHRVLLVVGLMRESLLATNHPS